MQISETTRQKYQDARQSLVSEIYRYLTLHCKDKKTSLLAYLDDEIVTSLSVEPDNGDIMVSSISEEDTVEQTFSIVHYSDDELIAIAEGIKQP